MSVVVVALAAGGLVLATFTVAASSAEPDAGAVGSGVRCEWIATGEQRVVPVARCAPRTEQLVVTGSAADPEAMLLRPKVRARPSA